VDILFVVSLVLAVVIIIIVIEFFLNIARSQLIRSRSPSFLVAASSISLTERRRSPESFSVQWDWTASLRRRLDVYGYPEFCRADRLWGIYWLTSFGHLLITWCSCVSLGSRKTATAAQAKRRVQYGRHFSPRYVSLTSQSVVLSFYNHNFFQTSDVFAIVLAAIRW